MFIDVNTSFGSWPFQLGGFTEMGSMAGHLKVNEIDQALVSHLGGVFYPDADHFNQALFRSAAEESALIPIPMLNLSIPGWEVHYENYLKEHQVVSVIILPSFHFYSLESDAAGHLAERLQETNRPLLLRMRLEDERNQYRGLSVEGVPAEQILAYHRKFPDLKIVCLNAYLPELIDMAGKSGPTLAFDFSFAERGNTLDTLLQALPPERLFFGSHTPILYTKSATMKVTCSSADPDTKNSVASGNARSWFFEQATSQL